MAVKNNPVVSVLMPVYNGMPYLPEAVESILRQTFTDFEFIIVNDGSTDGSTDFLNTLNDPRIVLIHLKKNSGLTAALQAGMERVNGKYIARLDADDVALPHRLKFQVEYLEQNPEIGLLGTACETIDKDGKTIAVSGKRLNDLDIRWKMLFKNPFVHSTVMIRTEVVRQHQLNYSVRHGEDYQLWADLLRYSRGIILPEVTIQYRVHHSSWTYSREIEQKGAEVHIALEQHKKYQTNCSGYTAELIAWVRGKKAVADTTTRHLATCYTGLLKAFLNAHYKDVSSSFLKDKLSILPKRLGWRAWFHIDMWLISMFFLQLKVRSLIESPKEK